MKNLAIICTHPIQYYAPIFKLLTERNNLKIKVFYTWGDAVLQKKYDPGFGKLVEWDIPLLDGYDYTFVHNTSTNAGSHHFKGIINPTLNKEIENWGANAVLVFGWNFVSHLKCLRYFKNKIPVFFRGDSTLLDEKKGIKLILRRLLLRWVYIHIDYAFYVGTNNKNYYLAHGLKENQLIYAPHAIDNNRFAQPNEQYNKEAMHWRENLGISKDDRVLLFAGKFEDKKNPFFILQLAQKIINPQIKFILVGNGVLESQLKLAAAKDDRVKFIDFANQQQMPVVYRLGDIFVLPSKGPGETWGLALNEAMACGKPVMATNKVGGAIDLIIDNKNGFIVDTNNANDCVIKINSMVDNRDLFTQMGNASKEIIQNFSIQNIVSTIENKINLQ